MSAEKKDDDRGSGLVRTSSRQSEPPTDAKADSPRRSAADLSPAELVEVGLSQIANLTGKEVIGVTSVKASDDGWLVDVEAIEDRRVPSSSDLLAVYEAQLAKDGTLIGYHRKNRYARGRGDNGGGP